MTTPENPHRLEPSELARRQMGHTALPAESVKTPPAVSWHLVQPEAVQRLEAVHLGRFQPHPGGPYHYRDSVDTTMPHTGFGVRIAQGSHGPLVLSALPSRGFEVAAAEVSDDGQLHWRPKDLHREDLVIAATGGNWPLGEKLVINDYAAIGNPGQYWGVVRVADAESGDVRYYAVGADVTGEPDNWYVHGAVMEVAPGARPLPSAGPPTLPSAE